MVSILDSIKSLLGIDVSDINFDTELIIHINGAIAVLSQLGVGPKTGYLIIDKNNQWNEFIGERTDLEFIKSDIYLRVRLIFDPPQNSFLVDAIKESIKEYDWRIGINSVSPMIVMPEEEV